jgi:hypothetical protein
LVDGVSALNLLQRSLNSDPAGRDVRVPGVAAPAGSPYAPQASVLASVAGSPGRWRESGL